MAIPADYPSLTAMWTAALSTMRAGWPTSVPDEPPNWSQYRCPISTDAKGPRFGIVTRPMKLLLQCKAVPQGIRLDEQNWLYIGPRAGLTPAQSIRATLETMRAWHTDIKARVPAKELAGYTPFGVVPRAWNANFLGTHTTLMKEHAIPLDDGEWQFPGQYTLLYITMPDADASIAAAGVR